MIHRKSFLISVALAFLLIWLTDFLIHGLWLAGAYEATASLWRSDAGMVSHLPWMLLGQFLSALAFTFIYAACVAEKACPKGSVLFGAGMGLFVGGGKLIMYAVQPLPLALVLQWVGAVLVQGILLGLLLFAVCRPSRKGV